MCYLYDVTRITYPQLVKAAQKAESEQENLPGEGISVRSTQAEGKDDITRLSEQITHTAASGNTEATEYHSQ